MKSLSYLLLITLSCPKVSHSACYMDLEVNKSTGLEEYVQRCDDVTVTTITQEDENGDTVISAVMGGDSNSDCNTETEVTMNGADPAYDASGATMFSFVDDSKKDSEFVDFSSNTVNNDAYKELCESDAVNGTYVELTYEAICSNNVEEGTSVHLYVYDQPRCYAQDCSNNDVVLFATYTIEPTIIRNDNDWSCIGDLDEDYDRCEIYQQYPLDSQINGVTPTMEDQKYFFGWATVSDRKTVIPEVSETFTSECSELNGSVSSITGIVECAKDGESMAFDLDGSYPVCRYEICDTEADILSYFGEAMVEAGEIDSEYMCASSTDTGENWFRDNLHLIAMGVACLLAGICLISMGFSMKDSKALPKSNGVSSL